MANPIDFIGPINTGVAAGGSGVATNNATSVQKLNGMLIGFYIRYNDSAPATTDVTIQAVNGALPTRTLLSLPNANTDGFFPVGRAKIGATDGSALTDYSDQPLIGDQVKVTVAQANNGDSVDVWPIFR